ncbi:MAG: DMT family transporter [Chitinophagales bacterium]|jgi:drug/metabolite transporter (DMT)-like permease
MSTSKQNATIYMHFAVLMWGFTAILGKVIHLREYILVWYRMVLVVVLLLFFPKLYKELKQFSKKEIISVGLIGFLVALHWVFFYGSIKFANASVALCALALTSLFTSIVEPIINRKRLNLLEFGLGLLVIPGVLLINQAIPRGYYLGWILGIVAALMAALFTSLNKKFAQNTPELGTLWLQLGAGALFLSGLLPIYIYYFPNSFVLPTSTDWLFLIVLVSFCTILPYILYLKALKKSTAFATNLINNLEPIYGIVLAAVFFNENQELGGHFYLGAIIILLAVFLHPIIIKYKSKHN